MQSNQAFFLVGKKNGKKKKVNPVFWTEFKHSLTTSRRIRTEHASPARCAWATLNEYYFLPTGYSCRSPHPPPFQKSGISLQPKSREHVHTQTRPHRSTNFQVVTCRSFWQIEHRGEFFFFLPLVIFSALCLSWTAVLLEQRKKSSAFLLQSTICPQDQGDGLSPLSLLDQNQGYYLQIIIQHRGGVFFLTFR